MTDAITNADKLACIKRELALRSRLYPKWVEQDRLTARKAAHEIACIEQIANDYQRIVDREREQIRESLFPPVEKEKPT
jgi:hypothetical protein